MIFASAQLSNIDNRAAAAAAAPFDIPKVKRRTYWETVLGPSTAEPLLPLTNVGLKTYWETVLIASTQPVAPIANANPKGYWETVLGPSADPVASLTNVNPKGFWETVLVTSTQPDASVTNAKPKSYWETLFGPSSVESVASTNNNSLNRNATNGGIPNSRTRLSPVTGATSESYLDTVNDGNVNHNEGNPKFHPPATQYRPLARSFSAPNLFSAFKPPSRPIPVRIPSPLRPLDVSRYFQLPPVAHDHAIPLRDRTYQAYALSQNPFSTMLGFGMMSQAYNSGPWAYRNRHQYKSTATGTDHYDKFGNFCTHHHSSDRSPWSNTSRLAAPPTQSIQGEKDPAEGSDDWVKFNHGSTFTFGQIEWNKYAKHPEWSPKYTPLDTSSDPIYDPATDPSTAYVASISKPTPGTTYLPSPPSSIEDGITKDKERECHIPLHQPQPVRPIQLIPFSELASSQCEVGDDMSSNASVSPLSEIYYSMDTSPDVSHRRDSDGDSAYEEDVADDESYYSVDGSPPSDIRQSPYEEDVGDVESCHSMDTSPNTCLERFSDMGSTHEEALDAENHYSMDTSPTSSCDEESDDEEEDDDEEEEEEEEEEEDALQLDNDEFYARLHESYRRATIRHLTTTVRFVERPDRPPPAVGGTFCECGCMGTIHRFPTFDYGESAYL